MQNTPLILTAADAQALPVRERVGLTVARVDTATMVKTFVAAEEAGVRQVWSTQSPAQADTLTAFAATAGPSRLCRLTTWLQGGSGSVSGPVIGQSLKGCMGLRW